MNTIAGYREWSTIGLLGTAIYNVVGSGNRTTRVSGAECDGNGATIPTGISFSAAQACRGHGWICIDRTGTRQRDALRAPCRVVANGQAARSCPCGGGFERHVRVHDAPAFTVLPQLLVWPKSPAVAILMIFNGPLPVFFSVAGLAGLVVPTV